ncbi:MAG: peptidylprolyl isomerase [Planctomycetota bacterium]
MTQRTSLTVLGAILTALTLQLAVAQETQPKPRPETGPKKEEAKPDKAAADPAVRALHKHIGELEAAGKLDRSRDGWKPLVPGPPPSVVFTPGATYYWHLQTNHGSVKIQLDPVLAPKHVTHFMFLSLLGFYDGLTFHRVIPGFMAQGGCPFGSGRGGPAYRLGLEISEKTKHDRKGVASTANSGGGNSDGSQFFLMFKPYPSLDPKVTKNPATDETTYSGGYSVFGQVVEGLETLDAFEQRGSAGGRPSEKLVIERSWISVE